MLLCYYLFTVVGGVGTDPSVKVTAQTTPVLVTCH